jgi:hypothetical protein
MAFDALDALRPLGFSVVRVSDAKRSGYVSDGWDTTWGEAKDERVAPPHRVKRIWLAYHPFHQVLG